VVPIELRIRPESKHIVAENSAIVERLARVRGIQFVDEISAGLAKRHTATFDVAVVYEKKDDTPEEREKKLKDIAKQEKIVTNSEAKLNDPGFTSKAPAHIVEGLNKQLDEARKLLDKLRRDLDGLNG
jgi:valyl-tRNA synthetase